MAHIKFQAPVAKFSDNKNQEFYQFVVGKLGNPVSFYMEIAAYDFNNTAVIIRDGPVEGCFYGGCIVGEEDNVRDTIKKLGLEEYLEDKK